MSKRRVNKRNSKDLVYYKRGVYVPGYEPKKWLRWLLVTLTIIVLITLSYWLINTLTNKSEKNTAGISSGVDNQLNKSLEGPYKVTRVVDGDTIDVTINTKTERIRFIGMDTPETVDPNLPVQCFGPEADKRAREILSGKSVYLELDDTQSDKDKYGRLLRHIFLEDKTNFSVLMIKEGYAVESTYDKPYKYQAEYKAAEKDAKNNLRGLWSPSTCNGKVSLNLYIIFVV